MPKSNVRVSTWLSPEVLNWPYFTSGGREPPFIIHKRAYEIWSHAEKRLGHAVSDLDLVDVIVTLKRAIEQRIRTLDKLYSFRSIPVRDKPSEELSLLGLFDVVRPVMFLRSTDSMLKLVSEGVEFFPDREESGHWLALTYGPADWNPELRGWIKSEFISTQPRNEWILINSEPLRTRAESGKRQNKNEFALDILREGRPSDIYLMGHVRGPQNLIIQLTKIYFSAV